MALFKTSTQEEAVFWEKYKDYSYRYTRHQLAHMLAVSPNRISVARLREYYYAAGVRPDEFMVRKLAPPSMDRGFGRDWQFEIRFAGPEVVSVLRLSGLII